MAQLLQIGLGYSPLRAGPGLLAWATPPMLIASLAGKLADRYGNRPFMAGGLTLQGVGLVWVAAVGSPHIGYGDLVAPFVVAGAGTSLCFPTVANAVMGSVPMAEAGVASGTNSAFREVGGVVGVAVLAAVFAHGGGYASPASFVAGFTPAIWAGVGVTFAGILAAFLSPGRNAAASTAPANAIPNAVANGATQPG